MVVVDAVVLQLVAGKVSVDWDRPMATDSIGCCSCELSLPRGRLKKCVFANEYQWVDQHGGRRDT